MKLFLTFLSLFAFTSVSMAELVWWRHLNDPTGMYLYDDNTLVGRFDLPTQTYRPFNTRTQDYGEASQAPAAVPPQASNGDYGVDTSRIHAGVSISGRTCTEAEAIQAIQDTAIPRDERFLRLTVIGNERDRERVLRDLEQHPELSPLRASLVVQDYDPNDWAMRVGFHTQGRPTIYLQQPDGKVLHRQDDYDGPSNLAGAIRRANDSYQASRDRDLRRTDTNSLLPILLLGGGVLLLLFAKEK